ncbi:hypothetical protein [Pseudoalteromonas sp. OOF1S-7]|uniref:hypothetical protein n=1 Tax=Pseudoalteromonas sp. OOF1S-7 TaxID=2917757 RepID=UPI001EF57953|nr:hypothetical protein [Pseudoalteromonas sp. OOF1S-7]MCG7535687.1 hypothetical protein [Pseudoalteromonas sp. OOF1S-7]
MYRLTDFYRLSATLTGYDEVELQGTGVGPTYCKTLSQWVRQDVIQELYHRAEEIGSLECESNQAQFYDRIWNCAKLGPVARNITKMWYLSIWYQLPADWNALYGVDDFSADKKPVEDYVISSNAYIQGLVWNALGSHPMGAKQPGYGTWALPGQSAKPLNLD